MTQDKLMNGGIFVEDFYALTAKQEPENISFPAVAILPLVQGKHSAGRWIIQTGDEVAEEQILTTAMEEGQIPLHASVPGYVEAVKDIRLPSGLVTQAAFLRFQGAFSRTGRALTPEKWQTRTPKDLHKLIGEKGVLISPTPLDALFPLPEVGTLDALVVNTMEPEPYVTLALNLIQQYPQRISEALEILTKLYSPKRLIVACDKKTSVGVENLKESLGPVEIREMPHKYPLALEPVLKGALGLSQSRSLFIDIPSLLAIWDAAVLHKPLIERHVLVSGDAVAHPGIYKVRLGMPIAQFLQDTGGFSTQPEKIIMGGPFRGHTVENLGLPVTKDTSAILVLSKRVVNRSTVSPCIRCGECIDVCPAGLQPVAMYKSLAAGLLNDALEEGVEHCIECGLCAFVCPSRLPLLDFFQKGKEEITSKEKNHG